MVTIEEKIERIAGTVDRFFRGECFYCGENLSNNICSKCNERMKNQDYLDHIKSILEEK